MSRTVSPIFRKACWRQPLAAAALALGLGACAYDLPIRNVVSQADISTCRRLGDVGLARTDGVGPHGLAHLAAPVRVHGRSGEVVGPNFGVTLDAMRESASALGATDLLLSRRVYRDWSYVAGIAYRCPR